MAPEQSQIASEALPMGDRVKEVNLICFVQIYTKSCVFKTGNDINFFQTGVILSSYSSSKASSSSWSESIIPVEVPNTSLTSFSSYILKNLDNETVYDVRVKALNSFGSSQFSKVFNFYVKTSGKQ